MTENQTIWKSNNQAVKEETFIQTSRRGRDGQPYGEDSEQGKSWRSGAGEVAVGGAGGPTLTCR